MLQREDVPNKKWLKKALWEWLLKHAAAKKIDFDPKKKYLKDKLWDLIKPEIGRFIPRKITVPQIKTVHINVIKNDQFLNELSLNSELI